jgi:riboflavin synthase
MYTGIIRDLLAVKSADLAKGIKRLIIEPSPYLVEGLQIGASVAIDGVCLTAVAINNSGISFDVIPETLQKTTLESLQAGDMVHVERSARMGDEIGGHRVSGHVYGTAEIIANLNDPNRGFTCRVPKNWMKYLLLKGFVAVDGASLTIATIDPSGAFSVHLIPETIRQTKLGAKGPGDWVNIEIDSHTQAIVDTLEAMKAN